MRQQRISPPRRARLWLAAFAVAVLGVLAAAPSALAVPGTFWGVVPQASLDVEQLQRLKAGGVDSIRVPISWGSVQSTRGAAFDWSSSDSFAAAAVAAGLEPLPFLSTAPRWAVPVDRRFGSPKFLPVRNGKQRSGWKLSFGP